MSGRQTKGGKSATRADMVLGRRLSPLPLADQVYEALQNGMLDGEFPAGTHLVQDAIAEQLGVSRTPVRDALIRLAQDQMIVAAGSRGYMVVEPDVEDLDDLLGLRAVLEPAGAVQALDNMSDRDFRDLEEVNAQFGRDVAPSPLELYEFNRQFHMGLVRKCPNRMIVQILDDLWMRPRGRWIWKRSFERGFDMAQSADEHDRILEVARARDTAGLEVMLRGHIESVDISSSPFA